MPSLVVIPAKAGAHPGQWQPQTNDATCVGNGFPTDAWMGPCHCGGDELGEGGLEVARAILSEVI